MEFVNLHNHSEYSLLDGMISIEEMVDFAVENNQPAIAVTDHGVMGSFYKFYKLAKKKGINPLIGNEFYLVEDINFRENREKGETENRYHLTAIAKNNRGLKNMFKLSSKASVEGFYYRPRICMEWLDEYKDDIIWLSGCMAGVLGQLIVEGKEDVAKAQAKKFKDYFNDFYIEIQPCKIEEQVIINPKLVEIGKELDIPIVATSDAHYLKEHQESHKILLGINSGGKIWEFGDDCFHLMDGEEMFEIMKNNHPKLDGEDIKRAISETVKLSEKCDVEYQEKEKFVPKPFPELKTDEEEFEKLLELIEKGWEEKNMLDKKDLPEYQERLEYELKHIKELNFQRYFLVVYDLYHNCVKPKNIMYGTGRGSSASSLVCCLLDITTPDPLKYDLIFERFISPNRITEPDIDMDFEDTRRDEIKEYLYEKYGRQKSCDIGTYGTMKGRQVLRDVSRVFDIPKNEVDKVSNLVIQRSGGDARFSQTIQDTFDEFDEAKKFNKKHPEVLKHCKNLEGRKRQSGTHAAGVVISPVELTEVMPIEKRGGMDGNIVTSLDGDEIEKVGFLKLDILGLNTLSVIKDTMEQIELTKEDFEKYNIDLPFPEGEEKVKMTREHLVQVDYNDKNVLQAFNEGETKGVFQFNSVGMSDTLKAMLVENFEDIVSMNALYRPGGMRSGMTHDFIDRRRGKEPIEKIHPIFDEITKPTYGLIVYQEQVMRIFREMAGFPAKDVDAMRKKVAKAHGVQAMEEEHKRFVNGCIENNDIPKEVAEKVFNMMIHFGSYGFNKSHAVVYSQIAYWTQWLKVYYPLEFFVASLNNKSEDDKVKILLGELEQKGYEILMPHINKSKEGFTVDKNGTGIRPGLRYIKGIGEKTAKEIVKHQPYEDEEDIKTRKGIKRRTFHKGIRRILREVGAWKDDWGKIEKEEMREKLAAEEMFPFPVMGKSIEQARELASHYDADFTDIDDLDFSKNGFAYLRGVFSGANYARIGDFGPPSPHSKWEMGQRYVMMDLVDGTAHIRIKFNPEKYQKYKDQLKIGEKVMIHGRIIKDIKMVFVDFMVILTEDKVKKHLKKYG